MIRALIEATGGALLIVGFAVFWLWVATPMAGAAECRQVTASWYGTESGTHTATGERFTGREMTAAMPSRKHLGERWQVSANGKSIIVRINDLGPAARLRRGIDLSKAAFAKLAPLGRGTLHVCIRRLS
jgi:rare lipoprotein A